MSERAADDPVWIAGPDVTNDEAADAAVAAAQAAAAVIRLTSHRRGAMFGSGPGGHAAVKIQTVFRGYLVSFRLTHKKCVGAREREL